MASSTGVKISTPIAKGVVGSSGAASAPETSSQSTEASIPVRHNSSVPASVVPIADHHRLSNSTAVGTAVAKGVGVDVCVGIVPARKSSVDIGLQAELGGAPVSPILDGGTQVVAPEGRREPSNSDTQVVPKEGHRISEGASQVDFGAATSAVGAHQEDRVADTPVIGTPAEQDEVLVTL